MIKKPKKNWEQIRLSKIANLITTIEERTLLSNKTLTKAKLLIQLYKYAYQNCPLVLVYTDLHFGNFIIEKNHITGILDLECIEFASLDYCMDIF